MWEGFKARKTAAMSCLIKKAPNASNITLFLQKAAKAAEYILFKRNVAQHGMNDDRAACK